jgi:hypothetical protein
MRKKGGKRLERRTVYEDFGVELQGRRRKRTFDSLETLASFRPHPFTKFQTCDTSPWLLSDNIYIYIYTYIHL